MESLPGAAVDSRTKPEGRAWALPIIATFEVLPCVCNQICFDYIIGSYCVDLPVGLPIGIGGVCLPPFA
jgi:hypothetical protein